MTLQELITGLSKLPPATVAPRGFHNPHSWRGVYSELAFEPTEGRITVGEMLAIAESALEQTYEGWKGGAFTMHSHTDVHIDYEGQYGGSDAMELWLAALAATPSLPAIVEEGPAAEELKQLKKQVDDIVWANKVTGNAGLKAEKLILRLYKLAATRALSSLEGGPKSSIADTLQNVRHFLDLALQEADKEGENDGYEALYNAAAKAKGGISMALKDLSAPLRVEEGGPAQSALESAVQTNQALSARLKAAAVVLEGYEAFEGEVIASDAAWNNRAGHPWRTEEMYDKWIELQAQRNAVLHPGKYSLPEKDPFASAPLRVEEGGVAVTEAMITAALASTTPGEGPCTLEEAIDANGPEADRRIPGSFEQVLDFSGANTARRVVRAALEAALATSPTTSKEGPSQC